MLGFSWRGLLPLRRLAAAALILLNLPGAVFADAVAQLVALEAQCEAQREEKIRPLREMEIEKCKTNKHTDPRSCERYWKDYGNAIRRSNGTMTPRMFDDLPACVASFDARKALANSDRN